MMRSVRCCTRRSGDRNIELHDAHRVLDIPGTEEYAALIEVEGGPEPLHKSEADDNESSTWNGVVDAELHAIRSGRTYFQVL
jgi:hypothetical protein